MTDQTPNVTGGSSASGQADEAREELEALIHAAGLTREDFGVRYPDVLRLMALARAQGDQARTALLRDLLHGLARVFDVPVERLAELAIIAARKPPPGTRPN